MLPGGRAPEYLRLDMRVIKMVQHFDQHEKPLGALCHAAQLLTAADIVRGKVLTCYPACAPEVELAGGKYIEVAMSGAVVDGMLVTAPGWPAHPAWLAKFLAGDRGIHGELACRSEDDGSPLKSRRLTTEKTGRGRHSLPQ